MNNQVKSAFLRKSSGERAQMISSARQYVKHDQFLNIIQNLDINDVDTRNKHKSTSIYWISAQLAAFNGVVDVCTQVNEWLNH